MHCIQTEGCLLEGKSNFPNFTLSKAPIKFAKPLVFFKTLIHYQGTKILKCL